MLRLLRKIKFLNVLTIVISGFTSFSLAGTKRRAPLKADKFADSSLDLKYCNPG